MNPKSSSDFNVEENLQLVGMWLNWRNQKKVFCFFPNRYYKLRYLGIPSFEGFFSSHNMYTIFLFLEDTFTYEIFQIKIDYSASSIHPKSSSDFYVEENLRFVGMWLNWRNQKK